MEKRKFITLKTGRNTFRKFDFDDILLLKLMEHILIFF